MYSITLSSCKQQGPLFMGVRKHHLRGKTPEGGAESRFRNCTTFPARGRVFEKKSKFSRIMDSKANFDGVGLMLKTMKRNVGNVFFLRKKKKKR